MKKVILLLPILAGIMFGSVGVFVRTLSANGQCDYPFSSCGVCELSNVYRDNDL